MIQSQNSEQQANSAAVFAHLAHPQCASGLKESKKEVIDLFVLRIQEVLPAADDKSKFALKDSIPDFIDEIVYVLAGKNSPHAPEVTEVAKEHGIQRASLTNFTLDQVLHEYAILRRVLFEILNEKGCLDSESMEVILDCLQEGVEEAAREFLRHTAELAKENVRVKSIWELFFNLPDLMLCIANSDGYFIRVNPAWEHTLGFSAKELMSKPWIEFVHPEDRMATIQEAKALAEGHTTKDFFNRYLTKSGNYIWLHWSVTPHGQDLYCVARDVSIIKASEEALRKAENKLRISQTQLTLALEAASMGTWQVTLKDNKVAVSPQFAKLYGVGVNELNGDIFWHINRCIHPDDVSHVNRLWTEAVANHTPYHAQFRVNRPDGQTRWIETRGKLTFDTTGEPEILLGTAFDITAMIEIEAHLEKTNLELERFAAIAARDLKAPLNSITQFTDLLASQYKGQLDPEADEYIEFIISAGNRMRALIDNLLEYARAGAMDKKHLHPIDMHQIIESVKLALNADILRSGALINEVKRLPSVLGIELQLSQLFQNLIANAIKFSKPNHPPRIFIDFQDTGEKFWEFSIRDEGIGIEPRHSEKVFEIFGKVHGRTEYEGTGIGLAVSKKIVEAHGGQIRFQSEIDQGTTFYFTLPKA